MLKGKLVLTAICALTLGFSPSFSTAFAADDTIGEKTDEAIKDADRALGEGARDLKEKGCELVNGKCAKTKVKNKAKKVGNKIEDALD